MKMNLKKEWSYPYIYVDVPVPFIEDYRMKMMKHNQIEHILKMTGTGRNGESRYGFKLKTGTSMDEYFFKKDISKELMICFAEQLLKAIEGLRACMLSPDGILLSPEFIFVDENQFSFCYLPVDELETPIEQSFHKMTEFFVDKIDYQDTDAILLSYRLHKESMKGFYDIRSMIETNIQKVRGDKEDETHRKQERPAKQQKKRDAEDVEEICEEVCKEEDTRDRVRDGMIYDMRDRRKKERKEYRRGYRRSGGRAYRSGDFIEDMETDMGEDTEGYAEDDVENYADDYVDDYAEDDFVGDTYPRYGGQVREQKPQYGTFHKVVNKVKTGRWGEWDDLITEVNEGRKQDP